MLSDREALMRKYAKLTTWAVFASIVTALLAWHASAYQPPLGGVLESILGFMEIFYQWLYVVPYLAGAVFGENVHNPNFTIFVVVLFAEVLLLTLVVRYIIVHSRKK